MPEYSVKIHPRLGAQLIRHAEFIARVSKPAANRFYRDFSDILRRLAQNPYQFPFYDDPNLPPEIYRKALFAKWYKIVFYIDGTEVIVDSVVDGRSDYRA